MKIQRVCRVLVCVWLVILLPAAASSPSAAADRPRAVRVVMIENHSLTSGLTVSGRLVSREEAVVATELTGYRVRSVAVDEGAMVSKGQVLVSLDDTLLRAELAQQRANVDQARVAAEKARQEAKRVAALDGSGLLSDEAIAARRYDAQAAKAALAQAQALLQDQLTRENLMQVRAPVAGRVLARSVRPGDVASPSAAMFRIARDAEVELYAEIPEQDLGFIQAGDPVEVELPSGTKVTGAIRLVGAEVDPDTNLGHARVLLPVRADLRPGGFARAVFQENSRPVPAVPESAVHYGASGTSITIVGKGDIVSTVDVVTGRRAGGYVELRQGPPPGTTVLAGGQGFVLDGDQVEPVPATVGGSQP